MIQNNRETYILHKEVENDRYVLPDVDICQFTKRHYNNI